MGWSLIAPTSPGSEPETYQLRLNSTAYIVLSSVGPSVGVVHQLHPDLHTELGRISQYTTSTDEPQITANPSSCWPMGRKTRGYQYPSQYCLRPDTCFQPVCGN
jgi:hypothetical protein